MPTFVSASILRVADYSLEQAVHFEPALYPRNPSPQTSNPLGGVECPNGFARSSQHCQKRIFRLERVATYSSAG